LTTGIVVRAAGFFDAEFAGAMTPAEITHAALFGARRIALTPMAPRMAPPILLAVSASDELLQALLPWRIGSLLDVACNVISAFGRYGLGRYDRLAILAPEGGGSS